MIELGYSASQTGQAITTAVDLFHITVGSDKPIAILGIDIWQTTDFGDAQDEIVPVGIYIGVTGGGGGTALTEVALNSKNTIAASSAVVGQGTASTGGTLVGGFGWNVRSGTPTYLPIPETRVVVSAGEDPIAIRLLSPPADSITMSATLYWME